MKGIFITLIAALVVYGFIMYLLDKWNTRKRKKRCRNYKPEEKSSGSVYLYVNEKGKIGEAHTHLI